MHACSSSRSGKVMVIGPAPRGLRTRTAAAACPAPAVCRSPPTPLRALQAYGPSGLGSADGWGRSTPGRPRAVPGGGHRAPPATGPARKVPRRPRRGSRGLALRRRFPLCIPVHAVLALRHDAVAPDALELADIGVARHHGAVGPRLERGGVDAVAGAQIEEA